jgi:hypothetical protein
MGCEFQGEFFDRIHQYFIDSHLYRKLVSDFLLATEPDEVAARRQHCFKRKRFYCAGVNDVWCLDQHDKWRHFGLYFHNGIDPFMTYNHWLKVWWTNRNPRLIAHWYFEAARKIGGNLLNYLLNTVKLLKICPQGVPLTTQSDPGTENYGVANAQTVIRHRLDRSLSDTLQHRWIQEYQV